MQVLQGMYNNHKKCKSSINSFFFLQGLKPNYFYKHLLNAWKKKYGNTLTLQKCVLL